MNEEESLQRRLCSAADHMPGRPLNWSETIAGARGARAVQRSWLAGAAALAVGAAVFFAGVRGDRPSRDVTRPAPGASLTTGESSATPGEGPEARAIEAARRWVDAITAGDAKGAWEMLGPVSRREQASFESFAHAATRDYIKDSFAGWNDDARYFATPVAAPDEGAVVVVTMVDETPPGPHDPEPARTLPVRVTPQGEEIEFLLGQYAADFKTPDPLSGSPSVARDATFAAELWAPTVAGAYFDVVDLEGYEGKARVSPGPGSRFTATFKPRRPLPSGPHVVTVVMSAPGGEIDAYALLFDVP